MNKVIKLSGFAHKAFALLAIAGLVLGMLPIQTFAAPKADIQICHATGSGFVKNSPATTADAGGHAGDDHQDGRDIIPPFEITGGGMFPGQNWDAEGQAIYNNGKCDGVYVPPPTKAKLTVTKTVAGEGATAQPNDFNLKVDNTAVQSGVKNEFNPGSYIVSETNLPNYTAGVWGGDCAANGAITLQAGDDKTCTITNTYVAPQVYICSDTIDNDGDGKVDYPADPGCSSATDNDETDTTIPPQCNDGIDNDGDGKVDYPADPGCDSATDNDESDGGGPLETGVLQIVKIVSGSDADESIFSYDVVRGVSEAVATDVAFSSNGVTNYTVTTGIYTVTENAPGTGWTASYSSTHIASPNDCEDITVIANATTTCTITNTYDDGGNGGPDTCSVEIVSDASDFVVEKDENAKLLTFIHAGWTALINGANWIWGDDPVVDPLVDETQTFRKQFGFAGTVTSATLSIASDNSYAATLNGSAAGTDAAENNFQVGTQDQYDVTSLIQNGNNELLVAVKNWGLENSVPTSNPAGLLYKLVIEGEVTSDADCSVPYVPEDNGGDEDTYKIFGYVWYDNNRNQVWDGRFPNEGEEEPPANGENNLSGWTITITNKDDNTKKFTTQTDADGYYEFEVPAGTWIITETLEDDWFLTTEESHEVTVPMVEDMAFVDTVMNFIIPVAHAALVDTYGEYNFGNDRQGGGGGGSRAGDRDGRVLGDSDSLDEPTPEPMVLGEQVSAVPTGAPDAGAGGAAPKTVEIFSLGSLAILGRSRKNA